MVMEELAGLPRLENEEGARAFLVLQRQGTRVFISTEMEDAKWKLENLMTEQWIPLGFVTYSAESAKAVTHCLSWYLELLKKDEARYKQLVGAVTIGLKNAAKELNEQLIKEGAIQRLQ
jgi:hypothetical protein